MMKNITRIRVKKTNCTGHLYVVFPEGASRKRKNAVQNYSLLFNLYNS